MCDVRKASEQVFAQAAQIIANGGLLVIPTDTVYGVACDPCNPTAIDRIYEIKQRPKFKALQVLMSSIDDIDQLKLDLPAPLNRLAAQFLPGAFSPIAVAREDCTLQTLQSRQDGVSTQGLRIPNSRICLDLLQRTGPLAASSANKSGQDSAQTVEEAMQAFGSSVDLYIDGGATLGHIASTVVAANPLERDGIEILREGVIPETTIRRALHINGGGLGA